MEKVARRIWYPCVNRKWGCEESFTIDDISGHQTGCFYSNRKCTLTAVCETYDWTGETGHFKEHLSSIHANKMKEVPDRQRLHLDVCTYDRKTLFPERIIATLSKIFIQRAVFTDRKDDSSKYNYKVSVSRKGGRGEISVSHFVSSDTDDLDKIRETGDCVHLQGIY
jgi:hypothetical protein